jgi:cytochrome c5
MVKAKHLLSTVLMLGVFLAGPVSAEYTLKNSIFSHGRTAERVKPDAQVCVEGDACGTAAAGGGGAAVARSADDIYSGFCAGCHATGAAGAPKDGDKAAWAPRIAQGMETVYKHAINGFNAMPPKGMCSDCSDDDIKGVVDLMVKHVK